MTKCDVILTYSWNRVGYNILKSLSSKGLNVWTADTSKVNICSCSKYCAGHFTYPDPFKNEDEFIECLCEWIKKLKPQMVLPTHDESIIIMRHRARFPQNLIIPYEEEYLLHKLSDKAEATKLAQKIGVPIPRTYNHIDEVETYPIVYKTVIGNSAKGVFFPKDKESLRKLTEIYKHEKTLLQEWVGGTDYSVDCIRWNHFWKASVYRARITKTNGGGTTTQREIVHLPILEHYAQKILDSVNFKGVCGLDFRYDAETQKAAFIEINARFTGGIATPIAAGFDIPHILYTLALKGNYEKPVNIKIGTCTKWILGDFITLVGRAITFQWHWRELKQLFTLKDFDAFDDFDIHDKKAILGEMYYYLDKLIRNRKLNP